ncbi:MAG: hypothetical protein OHK0046_40160 [Anaerolineae bacterium]
MSNYAISYPRRRFTRRVFKTVGNLLVNLLTRTRVTGEENLPSGGPLLLVGNHIGMLEVVLMIIRNPYVVEMIGAGDIPLAPFINPFVKFYGCIPVQRGSMDRKAMNMALDVLAQKGVVGLFPEGGIWEPQLKQVHTGVAWLSSKAQAPIVPIGFGGAAGAIRDAFLLKRPRLTMNIGHVIPPIDENNGPSRKQALNDGAEYVMQQVQALIPEDEKARWSAYTGETFTLDVTVTDAHGHGVPVPDHLYVTEDWALSKFLNRPVILSALSQNLKLPTKALQRLHDNPAPTAAEVAEAAHIAIDYIEQKNPAFLIYRFGVEQGVGMLKGLKQLRDLARWAAAQGYSMRVRAERQSTHTST